MPQKNIETAVKTVAPVVGKKLVKIGMRSLKDWANQKQLNEAIQSNIRQAATETADEYLDAHLKQERVRKRVLVAVRSHKRVQEKEKIIKIVSLNVLDYKHYNKIFIKFVLIKND